MTNKYDDIIGLPHPVSKRHARMSIHDRAAQFAPFAALTGYDDLIDETGRFINEKTELSEDRENDLNQKIADLRFLLQKAKDDGLFPVISIEYFLPDPKKYGGKYVEVSGKCLSIDSKKREIVLENDRHIPVDDIVKIESPLLERD